MKYYTPEACHNSGFTNIHPALSFNPAVDFECYRAEAWNKFLELLGEMPQRVPLELDIEYDTLLKDYREVRFSFLSEPFAHVPCHLLLPTDVSEPVPVVICLQGHSSGMHISLGRAKYPGDEKSIHGGRDIALQAVKNGYAALVLEQRCFGEREEPQSLIHINTRKCHHASMSALLLGRTIVGERVWDVSRAIDALRSFPEICMDKIICTGNSGGGSITYYSACFDSRIKIAIPSCAVCGFVESIGTRNHCQCNYIPGILKYFDMGDLACLIVPRPLIVVAGRDDTLFPLAGTQKVFDVIQSTYNKTGAPDSCMLLIGDEGHQYYPGLVWPEVKRRLQDIA